MIALKIAGALILVVGAAAFAIAVTGAMLLLMFGEEIVRLMKGNDE